MPDRLVLFCDGVHGFVELKRRGEVPKEHQIGMMQSLRNFGHLAFWVDSRSEIDLFVCMLWNGMLDPFEVNALYRRPLKFGAVWR